MNLVLIEQSIKDLIIHFEEFSHQFIHKFYFEDSNLKKFNHSELKRKLSIPSISLKYLQFNDTFWNNLSKKLLTKDSSEIQ